jgi:aryl-alcohol dehydrogenase-like predicted oxidoreductase
VGETFSGIPFENGIDAINKLEEKLPDDTNLAHLALRWVLMRDEVSCVIPGASSVEHVESNLKASDKSIVPADVMQTIDKVYASDIKKHVHQRW